MCAPLGARGVSRNGCNNDATHPRFDLDRIVWKLRKGGRSHTPALIQFQWQHSGRHIREASSPNQRGFVAPGVAALQENRVYLIIWWALAGESLQATQTATPLEPYVCMWEGARQRHLKRDKGAVVFGATCLELEQASAWTIATRGDYPRMLEWRR